MLSISGLSHSYDGRTRALDDVSLDIPRGMFGLLGPNGAGKSTLMRCIATLQTPTAGSDPLRRHRRARRARAAARARWATCRRTSASIRGSRPTTCSTTSRCSRASPRAASARDTVETLLQQVNLWDVRKKALAGFSGGMRQRFGIAQALIGRPAPDHRRRADRRPRPRGAQPLPQPARRDRRERGGDPVDPHRRGRHRPVLAHGDHGRRPDRRQTARRPS